MNQILSTQNLNSKQKRSGGSKGPKDITSVAKFFAIGLFIFGLFLIINSSYAMIKENGEAEKKALVKPTIDVENKGEDKLLLKVMHEDDIDKVTYSWNKENPVTVEGLNQKFYQKELDIPNGENVLYVTAADVNGSTQEFKKTFELSLSTNIDISISGNNIKINLEGQNDIKEFKYAWDEEEAKTVEVNQKEYSMKIQAPIGKHTLTVTAIDVNGEEKEKTQEVVGTTKPTVEISKGKNGFLIKAHDDIKLDKIEITTLEDGKVTPIQTDGKDFEYEFPLKENNENYIQVVAYNENGVKSKKIRAKWPKN